MKNIFILPLIFSLNAFADKPFSFECLFPFSNCANENLREYIRVQSKGKSYDIREYIRVKAAMAYVTNAKPDQIFPNTEFGAKGNHLYIRFLAEAYEKLNCPAIDEKKVFELVQEHCPGEEQTYMRAGCLTQAILEFREKKKSK